VEKALISKDKKAPSKRRGFLLSSYCMKKLLAKVKNIFSPAVKNSKGGRPLTEIELKREAEKFAEKYGDVLKKLAQE
jgi:hypothetical protein